ncbi:MAG: hypothetical protein COA65_04690 [Rhodospirillaceae bacterium]|nr:MAG: hypothetical protein COA65_04690 [Rhodospirillaceae bacterium]
MLEIRSDSILTTLIPLAYRNVPVAVGANFAAAIAVVIALSGAIASPILTLWLTGILFVSIFRIGLWVRFHKIQIDATNVRLWAHCLTIGAGAAGALWGLAGVFLFVPDNPYLQTFLIFVIGGMATGSLAVSGLHLPTFLAFFLTSFPPIGVRLFLTDTPTHLTMAALVAIYCIVIFLASLRISKTFAKTISLQQHLHAIMANVRDGIVTIGTSGRILSVNSAMTNMFGYAEKECAGKKFFGDLLPAEYNIDAASEQKNPDEAWQWGTAATPRELVAKRKDGSTFLADVATSNMTYAGKNMHIAILRDITEQKAVQIQLLQASKLATLGQMAAGIAHELNQPLNVIGMAAENARIRKQADEPSKKYTEEKLALIAQQVEKMGNIINHLRAFSRLDEKRLESFDLEIAANRSVQLVQDQLRIDNIQLHVQPSHGPFLVMGHPNQVELVLLNLLNNARDAIEKGREQTPAPKEGRIDVEIRADGQDQVRIRVSDNGPGIAAEDLNRIFDPFFTTKSVGKGTGLGLSITQGIVEAMGGQIAVTNTATGACFEVRLPRTPDSKAGKYPNNRTKKEKTAS